jgi:hypothetical protein
MTTFLLGSFFGIAFFMLGWHASRRALYREELRRVGLAALQRKVADAQAVLAEVSFGR